MNFEISNHLSEPAAHATCKKVSVESVWPIKNKRFFLVADYQSLVAAGSLLQSRAGSINHPSQEVEHDLEGDATHLPAGAEAERDDVDGAHSGGSGTARIEPTELSTFPTIRHILEKKGRVIVACTFSQIAGMRMRLPNATREAVVKTFQQEEGYGYTLFFASRTPLEKMKILANLPDTVSIPPPKTCSASPGSGKSSYFASLTNEEKKLALQKAFPAHSFKFDVKATSLPVVEALKARFPGVTITFVSDPLNATEAITLMEPGSIVVLENLRVYLNETSNRAEERSEMAAVLATYTDVFVDDCFRSAYRTLASTVELPKKLKHGAAGMLMSRELVYFERILTHPPRPTCAIVGGNRLFDKLQLIRALIRKVDTIIVTGEICLPFLIAKGWSGGKGFVASQRTLWDTDANGETEIGVSVPEYAARLLEEALHSHVRLVLPSDFVTTTSLSDADAPVNITTTPVIPQDCYAVDIGPNSITQFANEVRSCRTVVWAGPVGRTDFGFVQGTTELASRISRMHAVIVAAGLSTTETIMKANAATTIAHLSSGSNIALELLRGLPLPGVVALSDAGAGAALTAAASVILQLLKRLPLFVECSDAQLQTLSRKCQRRTHSVGDFIAYEGDCYLGVHIVAEGELLCCPRKLYGKSLAVRTLTAGMAAGQWEFLSQHPSAETVQVGIDETVTYYLSYSALQEAMSENPDLSSQLLRNCSGPLLMFAQKHHAERSTEIYALNVALHQDRKPFGWHRIEEGFPFVRSLTQTTALHWLTTAYLPLVKRPGSCVLTEVAGGLPLKLLHVLFREFSYNTMLAWCCGGQPNRLHHGTLTTPLAAAFLSGFLSSPLELGSRGVPFIKMTPGQLIDNGILCGVASLAPACAHGLYLHARSGFELSARLTDNTFDHISSATELFLIVTTRLIVGLVAFPVISRRHPAGMTIRNFLIYSLKQVLEVFLEVLVRWLRSRSRRQALLTPLHHRISQVKDSSPVTW